MSANKNTTKETPPEQRPLTAIQAVRLASLTGLPAKDFQGKKIADLSEQLKWKVDPNYFLFRQICGQVVKQDPVTGVPYPVPFATVSVQDTVCNFLSYFPAPWPWCWHFPILCHREVIGVTETDACGNFCVWIPAFEIEWILRWRLERVCYPVIFNRPLIGDLVPRVPATVAGPVPPVPGPNPGPLDILTALPPSVIEAVAGHTAGKLARSVTRLQASQSLGAPSKSTAGLLNGRAYPGELPPPLPAEFQKALAGQGVIAAKGASALEGIRSAIALKLGLAAKEIAGFNPQQFIGPFFRCYDIRVPEWQAILEVPDITFLVTQDVNGDGTEETIYSQGYFDTRWDVTPLPNVTLVASSSAVESRACKTPAVACGNVPAIMFAGFMPLTDPSCFDATNGWALRPNRPSHNGAMTPSPSDLTRPPAQTPFCDELQLYGCVDVGGAVYYRFLQSADGGATFSAITGQTWNNFLSTTGAPIPISSDPNGWYPVSPINPVNNTPVPRANLEFSNLLLDWPTPYGPSQSVLRIELGDASKNHLSYSANVAMRTDNTIPAASFTQMAWKFASEPDSAFSLPGRNLLGQACPTIQRGTTPRDIEVVVGANVAANRLRDGSIGTYGCGGSAFSPATDPLNNPSHWHTNVLDNNAILYQRYSLAGSVNPGCFSFTCEANSCAMNPSGADSGNLLPADWYYDPVYLYHYLTPISIAVVNEDAS